MFDLPYREIWALDTEFIAVSGALPIPVCLVARELISNRVVRIWQDELPAGPPWQVADDVLFLAYAAWAEWGCLLELGWPMPTRVVDLYVEFLRVTNGGPRPHGAGLLGACATYGLLTISKDEKTDMRDLVLRGGPWTADERTAILDYCQSDVDTTARLFSAMLFEIRPLLVQALFRGRYTVAVARMDRIGTPIDAPTLETFAEHFDAIKLRLIKEVDTDFGVYEGSSFRSGLFARLIAAHEIPWPRTETGRLELSDVAFRDQCRLHPWLEPLRQLRFTVDKLKLGKLAIGPDGRNRASLWPFGTVTGRNNMTRGGRSIWGPATYLRRLIVPPAGSALAYLDWSSQEIRVAGALSGDEALLAAYLSGDPYLWFARRAGLVPADATKDSHPDVRSFCKTALLGLNYGMQAPSLAARTGLNLAEAQHLMDDLGRTFRVFGRWAEDQINAAAYLGRQTTAFGWSRQVRPDVKPTALRNWPVQACGADMLRVAACLVTEAGIDVCAPVHDALLIQAPADRIAEIATAAAELMTAASGAVLGGPTVRVDCKFVGAGERYEDGRNDGGMWDRVMGLIRELTGN